MNADNGVHAVGCSGFGVHACWIGPARKLMISSMKLKLATLLDNFQEFLG